MSDVKNRCCFKVLSTVCCIALSSCGVVKDQAYLSAYYTPPMEQNAYNTIVPATSGNDCLYYTYNNSDLYVYDKKNSFGISSLNWIDGKAQPMGLSTISDYQNYYDICCMDSSIQYFDHHILYVSEYGNKEGAHNYRLNAIEENGSGIHTITEFPYQIRSFMAQNSYIMLAELSDDMKDVLHVLDLNGKELKSIPLDYMVSRITADHSQFFVNATLGDKSVLYSVSMEDLSIKEVMNDISPVYAVDNKLSYFTYQYPDDYETTNDASGIEFHGVIMNTDTKEILFEKDNLLIDYFDDQYIYASKMKDEHMTYQVYDWDGNVYREYVVTDVMNYVSEYPYYPISLLKKDFSTILRVFDGKLLGCCFSDAGFDYFAIDIETGESKWLSK